MPDPGAVYAERLAARSEALSEVRRRDALIANLRLTTAGVGALLVWLCLFSRVLSVGWLLAPLAVFAGLAVAHGPVIRERDRLKRAERLYGLGLARIEDRWRGLGRTGHEFATAEHPYAADLDVLGPGSLFERVSTARTQPGESTLATWLLAPAEPAKISRRQRAVAELRERLDLREAVALLGTEASFEIGVEEAAAWGSAPPVFAAGWLPWLAAGAAAFNVAALAVWWSQPWGSLALLPALGVSGSLTLLWRRRVSSVLRIAGRRRTELEHFADLLALIESRHFEAPLLVDLQRRLGPGPSMASKRVHALARLIEWDESRRNVLFLPVAALLLVESQLAFAVERWRAEAGDEVGCWLAVIGEFEALCSLAAHAFENPEDRFPEVVPGEARLEAEDLGHPLLPATACVRNDVVLGGELRWLLVSGSNMSGKSTLLRSVGVNVVLAQAGGAVRARRFRMTPLQVGASLTVGDSLAEGTSRFYAEIRRLRDITGLGREGPGLLFLLDEILHGTNSHDRRIGAEGVIRALLSQGGIGLVTTHDLALARIAEAMGPVAENVHFEDRMDGGRMVFDYKLRRGVVEKSNALELMRELGLEV